MTRPLADPGFTAPPASAAAQLGAIRRLLAALLFAAALAVIGTLGSLRHAGAHDWYPAACCHGADVGGDCAPIAASRVKETPAGYLVDGAVVKPYAETQWSPDGRYHACFSKVTGALRCLFAPERGS
jgi:hypothetical protein